MKSSVLKPLFKLYNNNQQQQQKEKIQQQPLYEIKEQNDIISLLPKEVVLKIFSFLSFQDLIRVQLVYINNIHTQT